MNIGFIGTSKQVLLSKAARHSLIIFAGNVITAAIGFVSILIIARTLSTEQFGVFSTFQSIMLTIVGLTNFGLGTALIRFISEFLTRDREKATSFLSIGFKIQLLVGILILAVGLSTASLIAKFLGNESEFILPVQLAILGGFGMSVSTYISTVFQSYQKFVQLPLWSVSVNLIKLLGVLALLLVGQLTAMSTLFIYAITPLLGFLIGLLLIPGEFKKSPGQNAEKEALTTIFHFGKWIALSYFLNSISGRSDIILLQRFQGSEAVGIYNAGFQLALVLPMIIGAVSTVLIPKVSLTDTLRGYLDFLRKGLVGSTFLALSLIPIYLLAPILVPLIFGGKYEDSVFIFQLLLINYGLNFLIMPVTLLFLPLNRTDVGAFVSAVQLVVIVGLQLILIPGLGAVGAIISLIASTLVASVIYILFLLRLIRELK